MTALLLVFGAALLLGVLTSSVATRSPLSTTGVFLAAGIVAGPLALDVVDVTRHQVEIAAEIALFAILFTDGQHAPLSVVRRYWRAPTRALLLGMPLSTVIVAALGHWIAGLPWASALVLGAVLAPTDPVFASALVGREDVPKRVRHMLNIESGLNDGLALLAVLVLVGVAGGDPAGWSTDPLILLLELVVGIVLGVVLPLGIELVLRLPGVDSVPSLRPLGVLAVAVLLFAVCDLVHANVFLAAFVAGITIATVRPRVSESFSQTGELISELTKGAALIAFAGLLQVELFADAGWTALVVAVLVVAVSRPLPILLVLLGTELKRPGRLAVAWFGPKGFASVVYAVIVASSGIPRAEEVFTIVAVTVLLSVLAHSTTDVAVAGWLQRDAEELEAEGTRA